MGIIPNDYTAAVNSVNLGKPLIKADPRSKISREIRRITRVLSGETGEVEEMKSKKSWGFLLKGQWVEK